MAGVVGVMMALIMGARDEVVLDRASDLGLGFQLTNISRDVIEDAGIGRIYVPGTFLDMEGVPEAGIADPEHRANVAAAVARLLDVAEPYYEQAVIGMGALPFLAAAAVGAARCVYRAIGTEVRRRGAQAWDARLHHQGAEDRLSHAGHRPALGPPAAAVPSRRARSICGPGRDDPFQRRRPAAAGALQPCWCWPVNWARGAIASLSSTWRMRRGW